MSDHPQPTNEAEWLAAREHGIGASEAAAILGYSNFSSPWAVWAKKTNRVDDMRGGDTPMMEWGHRHEDAIAKKFAEETGRYVEDTGEYYMVWVGNLFCTVDRFQSLTPPKSLLSFGEDTGVLELKCAYYDAFKEWESKVPIAYQIQIQQQMHCTGLDFASIAVLGNGYQFKYFHVERNQKFIDRMVEVLEAWWEKYVIGDTPPPADGHKTTAKVMGQVFSDEKDGSVWLNSPEQVAAHKTRERTAAKIKKLEKQHAEATNVLRLGMGEATIGILPDTTGYTYKAGAKGRTLRRTKKCLTDSQ